MQQQNAEHKTQTYRNCTVEFEIIENAELVPLEETVEEMEVEPVPDREVLWIKARWAIESLEQPMIKSLDISFKIFRAVIFISIPLLSIAAIGYFIYLIGIKAIQALDYLSAAFARISASLSDAVVQATGLASKVFIFAFVLAIAYLFIREFMEGSRGVVPFEDADRKPDLSKKGSGQTTIVNVVESDKDSDITIINLIKRWTQ